MCKKSRKPQLIKFVETGRNFLVPKRELNKLTASPENKLEIEHMEHKGSSINDATHFWRIFDTPPHDPPSSF